MLPLGNSIVNKAFWVSCAVRSLTAIEKTVEVAESGISRKYGRL